MHKKQMITAIIDIERIQRETKKLLKLTVREQMRKLLSQKMI